MAFIEGRNGGRAEGRVDFGLISISAEPVSDFHLGRAGTGMSIRKLAERGRCKDFVVVGGVRKAEGRVECAGRVSRMREA